jgi:hypothetical protein
MSGGGFANRFCAPPLAPHRSHVSLSKTRRTQISKESAINLCHLEGAWHIERHVRLFDCFTERTSFVIHLTHPFVLQRPTVPVRAMPAQQRQNFKKYEVVQPPTKAIITKFSECVLNIPLRSNCATCIYLVVEFCGRGG